MPKTPLSTHLRCFALLYRNHAPVHFLGGFTLMEFQHEGSFLTSLLGGALICALTAALNLLTYFWRQRYRPAQLAQHHLRHLTERYTRLRHPTPQDRAAFLRDLETLWRAPYLSPAHRSRVEALWNQVQSQPSTPLWHVRYQLERLLEA